MHYLIKVFEQTYIITLKTTAEHCWIMCLKAILESSNNYLLYSYKLRETFRLGYGFVCMSRCMTLTQSTSLIWERILSWFNNTCTCIYFLKCHTLGAFLSIVEYVIIW